MVNEPVIGAVPAGLNNSLTVCHQEDLVMRPTPSDVRGRSCPKLVEFPANFLVGDQ